MWIPKAERTKLGSDGRERIGEGFEFVAARGGVSDSDGDALERGNGIRSDEIRPVTLDLYHVDEGERRERRKEKRRVGFGVEVEGDSMEVKLPQRCAGKGE
jgi:hypothetical protein